MMKKKLYKLLSYIFCILFVLSTIYVEIPMLSLVRWEVLINNVLSWIVPVIFFILFTIFYILYKKEDNNHDS